MSNSFNVVLTGELLKGQSIMQAANSLSRLFKIAPLQAQQMLARAPLVIKKNLEEDTAVRFVQAMYKSGFGASVEQQKATKTSLLLHTLAPLYEDDDEGATVTKITPVLVEQSRLDESLDNELSIPADKPLQVAAVVSNPSAQCIDNQVDECATEPAEPALSTSLVLPTPIVQEETPLPQEEVLDQSPAEMSLQDEILQEKTPQVENQLGIVLLEETPQEVLEEVELSAKAADLNEAAAAIALLDADEADAASAIGLVSGLDVEDDASVASLELAATSLTVEAAEEVYTRAFDPFAAWSDEDHKTPATDQTVIEQPIAEEEISKVAAQIESDNTEEVVTETAPLDAARKEAASIQAQLIFDNIEQEVIELAATSSVKDETLAVVSVQNEIHDTSEVEQISKAPSDELVEDKTLEPVAGQMEVQEIVNISEDEGVSARELASESVAVSDNSLVGEHLALVEQVLADEVIQDVKTIELVPIEDLVDSVEAADADVLEVASSAQIKDLEALQWVEPVAQWQTVAELADAVALDRAAAADDVYAEAEAMLTESVSTQTTYAEGTPGGKALFQQVGGVEEQNAAANNKAIDRLLPAEHASHEEHWDAPVQVSPALTERLAQIAEQSRENISEDDALLQIDIVDADAAAIVDNDSGYTDGVLLFEEADVSQISSLDGQDWHLTDGVGESKTIPAFNPLLDFDQVEPDWKDRRVDLIFAEATSVPAFSSSFDLDLENQQELQAFLASSDYDDRPTYADPQPLTAVTAELTDIASQDQNPTAEPEFTAEILAADLVEVEATVEPAQLASEVEGQVDSGWTHKISVQAECGFLEVSIPQGRELNVAAAASVTMGLSLHEQLQAGNGVKAWLLAKGFLINTYEAVKSTGNLGITAITHGMVCGIDESEFPVMVQQSAFLASTDEVKLNADQSRLNPVVNACKWMHCSGAGELWLNAQGLWEMIEVDGSFTINSRYIMAFSQSLKLQAPPLAGLKSYLTSGGGVECRLKGRGLVWVQTEAAKAPVLWQKTG